MPQNIDHAHQSADRNVSDLQSHHQPQAYGNSLQKTSYPQAQLDPRSQIRKRVRDVSVKIDKKRRYLLRSDRIFEQETLSELATSLEQIIEQIEAPLNNPLNQDNELPQNNSTVASLEELNSSNTPTKSSEKPDITPQKISLKDYLIDCLPQGKHAVLEYFIRSTKESKETIKQHFADNSDSTSNIASNKELTRPEPQHKPQVFASIDPAILSDIKLQLHSLFDLSPYWDNPPSSWLYGNGRQFPLPDWAEMMDVLQDELEQANKYIEILRGNCRLDVARQLNRLKTLFGRIQLYSSNRSVIKCWSKLWSSPQQALLSSIDRVDLAVSDAELGTACVLELLRSTEIAVDRVMYRYEYGSFGLFINRFNDIKRFIGTVKRWHDSGDDFDLTVIQGRILLGLSVTSVFWLMLFLSVSSFSIAARVVIQIITPPKIQEDVKAKSDQFANIREMAEGYLTRYRKDSNDRIQSRINDQEQFIQQSISFVNHLIDNHLIDNKIDASLLTENKNENNSENEEILINSIKSCNFQEISFAKSDISKCLNSITSLEENKSKDDIEFKNLNLSTIIKVKEIMNNIIIYINDKEKLIKELERNENLYDEQRQQMMEEIASIEDKSAISSSENTENIDNENNKNDEKEGEINNIIKNFNKWINPMLRELFPWSRNEAFNGHINRIMLALLAGAIGSVISILMRMNDLELEKINSPFLLGLLQPLIGAFTSVVVVAILSTDAVDIISIFPEQLHLKEKSCQVSSGRDTNSVNAIPTYCPNPAGQLDTHEVYKILIIGFFIGFSERLTKDALGNLSSGGFGNTNRI